MKRNALFGLFVFLLVSLSIVMASAGANAIAAADCDGWSFRGSFTVPADIEYTIDLFQDGVKIWTLTETPNITPNEMFLYSGVWDMELCGDYSVHIDFNYDMGQGWRVNSYDIDFTCECEYKACTYTPNYWKNHLEAWPVENLTVGCVDYTKDEILDIFSRRNRRDMTIKLFRHLVAAKLNVLGGADDNITGTIMAGDDFLCTNPLGSRLKGRLRKEARNIKKELAAYNRIPCETEYDDEMLAIDGPSTVEKAAATEESSWGSIKKMHQ